MEFVGTILPFIQIVLAILLVTAILMQRSDAGLGGAFGGSDTGGAGIHTKRGFERTLFKATIVIAVLFVVSAFLALVI